MLMDQFIPSITHFKSSMIITYSIVISWLWWNFNNIRNITFLQRCYNTKCELVRTILHESWIEFKIIYWWNILKSVELLDICYIVSTKIHIYRMETNILFYNSTFLIFIIEHHCLYMAIDQMLYRNVQKCVQNHTINGI